MKESMISITPWKERGKINCLTKLPLLKGINPPVKDEVARKAAKEKVQ